MEVFEIKTDLDKKIEEFEAALGEFSLENDSILVARYNENREPVRLPSIKNVSFHNIEDLFDEIRKRYMDGIKECKFLVQLRNKNGFSKGFNILIENPLANKENLKNDKTELDHKVETLFELIKNQQNQKSSSREEILKEMAMMKEIISGSNNASMDMSKVYLDMSRAMREGFQLGREFNAPEKKEEAPSIDWGKLITQAVPLLLQKKETTSQIQSQPVFSDKSPVNQSQFNEENQEMFEYLSLIKKIKETALMENKEEQQVKIETIGNYIIDFMPKIINYIDLVKDDTAIEGLLNKYGVQVSDQEKMVCKKIIAFIKDNIQHDSNNPNS